MSRRNSPRQIHGHKNNINTLGVLGIRTRDLLEHRANTLTQRVLNTVLTLVPLKLANNMLGLVNQLLRPAELCRWSIGTVL